MLLDTHTHTHNINVKSTASFSAAFQEYHFMKHFILLFMFMAVGKLTRAEDV